MDGEKRNRIAAAITVNVILLIVILCAVVLYQVVYLSRANAERNRLIEEIKQVKQEITQTEDEIDRLNSEFYLREKAYELGYR